MRTPVTQRGITLVEAAIVVAVAAVTVTSAAPSFHRFIEKQRLDGAAAQLATDLRFARAEAIARNTALRFSVQATPWGGCHVIHSGAAQQCRCAASGPAVCDADAREIKTVQWPAREGIALHSNVTSMLFDPLHGTSTPAGTLRLVAASGRTVHHVVNVMGRVRACSPQEPAIAVPGYRAC
ncbi:GspH/FimT family protein [Piscinibacter sp. XHJ-5]|uniref:GspH/FimT family protein n=1 Tax=Piscinibacter sp. XHJ-5 TaxID=3037797 RepID=UPI002452F596|nr:GspH/FimT family protein [Piscinibacter sp. XHJ-5]